MDQALINRIIEAALLAHGQPVPLAQLRELFPDDEPAPNGAIETALAQLRDECATRGVELVEVASGFRYQVSADVHPWVARLSTERQTRYTRATLETLALIAYRQPITRGEIEQVRGVSVSSNTIKALEEREWIRVVGHRDVPGRPALFGTTKVFLDYFGLKRLDELPPLSELKDLGELEPQLQFDGASGVDARIAAQVALPSGEGESESGNSSDGTHRGSAVGGGEHADACAGGDADERALKGTNANANADADANTDTDANPDTAIDAIDGDDAINDGTNAGDEDTDFDFRRERPVVFHDTETDTDIDADADTGTDKDTNADPRPGTIGSNEHPTDAASGDVHPEAAPGMRVATGNDRGSEAFSSGTPEITALTGQEIHSGPIQNTVEMTTVPAMTSASIDAAEPNSND